MKHILAVDGGGVRGYVPLAVLKYIEQATGKPSNALFDVFAGNSTGAIVATALAQGKSAAEVEAFYDENIAAIFKRRWANRLSFGLTGPKYDAVVLEAALHKVLGEGPIPDKAFLCTTGMNPLQPVMLSASHTPDWKVCDAVRASSAAPTYFSAFVRSGEAYWDGGCTGGNNNPALTAIETLGLDESQIRVLSLGCGRQNEGWTPKQVLGWSELETLQPLLAALMDASSEQVHQDLLTAIPARQYLRLQPVIGNASLDDASAGNIRMLKAVGAKLVEDNRTALDAWLESATLIDE